MLPSKLGNTIAKTAHHAGQKPITFWLPEELAARLDRYLVAMAGKYARPSRQAFLQDLVWKAIEPTAKPTSGPVTPQPEIAPITPAECLEQPKALPAITNSTTPAPLAEPTKSVLPHPGHEVVGRQMVATNSSPKKASAKPSEPVDYTKLTSGLLDKVVQTIDGVSGLLLAYLPRGTSLNEAKVKASKDKLCGIPADQLSQKIDTHEVCVIRIVSGSARAWSFVEPHDIKWPRPRRRRS